MPVHGKGKKVLPPPGLREGTKHRVKSGFEKRRRGTHRREAIVIAKVVEYSTASGIARPAKRQKRIGRPGNIQDLRADEHRIMSGGTTHEHRKGKLAPTNREWTGKSVCSGQSCKLAAHDIQVEPYYWFSLLKDHNPRKVLTPGNVPPTLQFAEGDTACSSSLSEKFVIGVCNGESDDNCNPVGKDLD
ncbi:hypothetical protein BJV77DRAFT_961219 [Russula vinacea]|nr:hypothetical protein BJV77DRAFT_961219 [Russula vinacea]